MDENIFCLLVNIELECGTYQSFAENKIDAVLKTDKIFKDARENYCDHKIVNITVIPIAKRGVNKKFINKLYFIYAGNCAFGA